MSRMQRMKGKRGELAVAALLKPLYPEVRTKRAGGESATQDRGRDLLGTPGLCVQVKEQARPNPLRALDEATRVAAENEIPVAFVKELRGEWVAVLSAEDLLGLLAIARSHLQAEQFGQLAIWQNQIRANRNIQRAVDKLPSYEHLSFEIEENT